MTRDDALESLRLRFTSGNSVPVNRASINRDEYEALAAAPKPAAPPSVTDAEMVAELRKILAIAPNASTHVPMKWAAHRDMTPEKSAELLAHVVTRTVEDGYFSGEMHLIEESDSGHAIAYTGCGLKSGHNAQFLVACAHFVLRFGEALTHPGHKHAQEDNRIDRGAIAGTEQPESWDAVDEALWHWYGHKVTFTQSERRRFFDAIQTYLRAKHAQEDAAQEGWIAISERLPEINQPVVVINVDRYENVGGDWIRHVQDCAYLCHAGGAGPYWSRRGAYADSLDAYTHWSPLPLTTPIDSEAK